MRTPLALPGMSQAIALRKRFKPVDAGAQAQNDEWRYYATSAPHYHAPAPLLARAIRGHWGIENQLHYPKDHTQGEDQHVLRKGNAPSNLSLLRSMVLVLLSRFEIPDLVCQTFPQKMAYFSANVERVVRVLSGETEN